MSFRKQGSYRKLCSLNNKSLTNYCQFSCSVAVIFLNWNILSKLKYAWQILFLIYINCWFFFFYLQIPWEQILPFYCRLLLTRQSKTFFTRVISLKSITIPYWDYFMLHFTQTICCLMTITDMEYRKHSSTWLLHVPSGAEKATVRNLVIQSVL